MPRRRGAREAVAPTPFPTPTDAIYAHADPIFEVPVEACFYPYVYAYAPNGWHPFVATVREILADDALRYHDSTLYRYYCAFQPATVREVLFEDGADASGAEALERFPASAYLPLLPWDPSSLASRGEKGLDAPHGNQGYGPVSEAKGELEFRRLAATARSIARHGYRPRERADGEIRGYFLKTPSDYRFVIRSGLHRTAALAALGYGRIRVGLYPHYPRAIHLGDVGSWPLVREGVYREDAAQRYFRRFFQEDGCRKAQRLGLLPAPGGGGST